MPWYDLNESQGILNFNKKIIFYLFLGGAFEIIGC